MAPPLLLTIAHYSVCCLGMAANITLLLLIVSSTPNRMRSYASILFTISLTELATVTISLLLFMRILPTDNSIIMTSFGPLSSLHSPALHISMYSAMLWGHSLYCELLAVCFCFRIFVVQDDAPKMRSVMCVLAAILLPNAIVYSMLPQTELRDAEGMTRLLEQANLEQVEENQFSFAAVSVFVPRVIAAVLFIIVPFLPSYTIIILTGHRFRTVMSLHAAHMSEQTRRAHKEIVMGLMLQSCLPIVDVISIASFLLLQLQLTQAAALGLMTHMCGEVVISANPLITLYTIRPYRNALLNSLSRTSVRKIEPSLTTSTQ